MKYIPLQKRKGMIIIMAVLFHYAGILVGMLLPVATVSSYRHVTGTWFDHFLQWDALWYYAIGHYGYIMPLFAQHALLSITNAIPLNPPLKAAAFFPGLPFVIKLIGTIPALFLGNALFILCVILLYKMVDREVDAKTAMVSVLLFAVNPASLYFTALYSEPYIVFCSMVILYAMQKETRRGDRIAFVLCVLWPIYIAKNFIKQRHGKVWFGTFFVLFLIVTMIGAALYTHGQFYE